MPCNVHQTTFGSNVRRFSLVSLEQPWGRATEPVSSALLRLGLGPFGVSTCGANIAQTGYTECPAGFCKGPQKSWQRGQEVSAHRADLSKSLSSQVPGSAWLRRGGGRGGSSSNTRIHLGTWCFVPLDAVFELVAH